MSISANLEIVKNKIDGAMQIANRTGEVKLVAVTKTVEAPRIKEAITLGIGAIGENKVQEAMEKKPQIKENVEWHMIGHLQSNKAGKCAETFDWVHSIDSLKIANKLNSACLELNKKMKALIEVNVSGEQTKCGIKAEELPELAEQVKKLENLELVGLMTMAPYFENPEQARPMFRKLKELNSNLNLQYLSMGMSQDFEIAVQEGANIIRIGTAIFGLREAA